MKRWVMSSLTLVFLLLPVVVLAGGAGHIKLNRTMTQVAIGKVPVFAQALQHDVHPLGDAEVTIRAVNPAGQATIFKGAVDPSYGVDNVYRIDVNLDQPGTWNLTLEAKHVVFFPPETVRLEALAAGARVPSLGPLQVYHQNAADDHSHTGQVDVLTVPGPDATPAASSRSLAASTAPALLGGAGVAIALAGVLIWRRRMAPR